jgi:hypothetical protein
VARSALGTIQKCGSPALREYGRSDLKADVTLLAFHRRPQVIAPLREEDDYAQSGKCIRSDGTSAPWNKGKLIDAKPPLLLKHVWSIRSKLRVDGRICELAMFNLAIDSKLRGCDVVSIKVEDIAPHGAAVARASVRQRKTGRIVRFELTEQTRETLDEYLRAFGRCPSLESHFQISSFETLVPLRLRLNMRPLLVRTNPMIGSRTVLESIEPSAPTLANATAASAPAVHPLPERNCW